MHLASLAQAYELPTRTQDDEETEEGDIDAAGTADDGASGTDLVSTLGLIVRNATEDEADLDAELPDAPGLAQAPDEPDGRLDEQLAHITALSQDPAR